MPTRYRRVGVVLDPELSDALSKAAERVSASTEAGRLRELALLGARALDAGESELEQARTALDELGATRERGDLLAISRRLRARKLGWQEDSASETLEWVRGER